MGGAALISEVQIMQYNASKLAEAEESVIFRKRAIIMSIGKKAFVLTLSEITASFNIDRYAENLKELVKDGLHKRNRKLIA